MNTRNWPWGQQIVVAQSLLHPQPPAWSSEDGQMIQFTETESKGVEIQSPWHRKPGF